MLSPEQFDTDEDIPGFTVPVENLRIADHDIGPVKIPVTYNHDWRPIFHLGAFDIPKKTFFADLPVSFRYQGESGETDLLVTRRKFDFNTDSATVEARLKREPLVLRSSDEGRSFKGVLLSPPKFLQSVIYLNESDSIKFQLTPFKTKNCAACLFTSDANSDVNNPLKPFSNLVLFLTFVKGSHCGMGNVFAYGADGSIAYRLLGFTRNDEKDRETNWFDLEIQNDLPAIFTAFCQATADNTTRLALEQAISFYRSSNASRNVSIEMAIIAAHSALEAIVNYILKSRAGWSQGMMKERSISFSDKMRAAASYYDVSGDPLEHSPELTKFSKSRNDSDVYFLISFFRNKLVHQDNTLLPTGLQLHEAWLITQWLVEVLIFGVIGHKGKIIDRRIYRGYRGTTCQIPIRR